MIKNLALNLIIGLVALASVACGGSAAPPAANSSASSTAPTKPATGLQSAGSLGSNPVSTPENSPGGDIPDTANFLIYHAKNYSMQYVEGWAQQPLPNDGVRIADKDSFVSVSLATPPSGSLIDYVNGDGIAQTTKEFSQFVKSSVKSLNLPAGPSVHLTFKAQSAPDPVTGKRVTLDVDRYYIAGPQFLAVLTEATPTGVDNVDPFLQIANSFKWGSQ